MLAVRRGKQSLELPEILAGPILRRVDRETWSAFMVLSRPINLGVQVYTASYKHHCTFLAEQAIQLSESIYVYQLTCDLLENPLPLDELIHYEIYNAVSRESLTNQFAMKGEKTCTFIVKSEANVLFGSCRKIHAERADILSVVSNQQNYQGAKSHERASLLFMAGDQIYADDVLDSILLYIRKWTDVLFDWPEQGFKKPIPKAGERKSYMHQMGLTTDKGDSHLVTFQEYVTMYLLAWSPALWEVQDIQLDDSGESSKHREGIDLFKKSLKSFQRLLANTPTYMLIDDHDVTDDWNIHGEWFSNIWDGTLNSDSFDGARVLSNAYLAGLIFQMSGNGRLDRDLLKELTGLYKKYISSSSYEDFDAMALFQEIRDFKGSEKAKDHSFILKPNDREQLLVLDTRTARCFNGDSDDAAQLLCPTRLRELFAETQQAERLIIVSPTPIFGFRKAEAVQQSWFWSRVLSPAKLDREAWSHNKEAFETVLKCLNEHSAIRDYLLGR